MTNDIVKIKSVAPSQGGETEHGLMLDSSILSYTYQGSSKTVKWILDTIFTLLGGKASSSTTLAGYGITDAYTKTEVDTALAGKANTSHTHTKSQITDFAHNHSQSDITGLAAALAAKENQGNKLDDWDNFSEDNGQYPTADIVKEELDKKAERDIIILPESTADLDELTVGNKYYIDNGSAGQTADVLYSSLGRAIHYHQGYSGGHSCQIIFSVYLINNEYFVTIDGLYTNE